MNAWLDDLERLSAARKPVVIVTVAGIRGSAPREVGAKMLVTDRETVGTIGGGQLEYRCARIAFDMLSGNAGPELRRFPLGPSMGQCCGGVVDILFEPLADPVPQWLRELLALHERREPAVMVTRTGGDVAKAVVTPGGAPGDEFASSVSRTALALLDDNRRAERRDDVLYEAVTVSDFNVAVFGAGHVGCAVVRTLAGLHCQLRWIDSRRNVFTDVPRAVQAIETENPALEVAAMPENSFYLVMTHSHAIDFEICERILQRSDVAYCGLIGSMTKRRRFDKRLRALGIPAAALDRLVCPIGVDGIRGKKPAEIAISVSAQMLRVYERSVRCAGASTPHNVTVLR